MKTVFYYLRGLNGQAENATAVPIITVCLVRDKYGVVSRGLAICSVSDHFSKKIGRDIAANRAIGAAKNQRNIAPLRSVAELLRNRDSFQRQINKTCVHATCVKDECTIIGEYVLQGWKGAYDIAGSPLCKKERHILKSAFGIDPNTSQPGTIIKKAS